MYGNGDNRMTKRRLINKKAYEEMLLLKELLDFYDDDFTISIQLNYDDKEMFVVDHFVNEEWKSALVGENYTNISKILISYLSKLK